MNPTKSAFEFVDAGVIEAPGAMMADARLLELCLLDDVTRCRIYTWDRVWVTLGRFQNPSNDLVSEAGVGFTVRPTGGKAVLHGHDVTVALAAFAPLGAGEGRSVSKIFEFATAPLLGALRDCGLVCGLPIPPGMPSNSLPVGEGPRTEVSGGGVHVTRNQPAPGLAGAQPLPPILGRGRETSPYCFETLGKYDIIDLQSRQKVCGCALKIVGQHVLLQASIPYKEPLIEPSTIIKDAQDVPPPAWNWQELPNALMRHLEYMSFQ